MTSLSTWSGISSGFQCADTLPILLWHIDMISNDSIIVVTNWWCAPFMFDPMLIDLRKELHARGKQVALFAEPPGIAEPATDLLPMCGSAIPLTLQDLGKAPGSSFCLRE